MLLLRKQRMLRRTNKDLPSHRVIGSEKDPAAESTAVKRPAVKAAAEEGKEGPERKRVKISWP